MTSKKIKQKYNQSLQLSVTEHFNKTILCIVLLILFTPYQEMIYPLSTRIKPLDQIFFIVYSGSDSDTIFCGTPIRTELNWIYDKWILFN